LWVCEIDASSFVGLRGFKLLLGARDEIGVIESDHFGIKMCIKSQSLEGPIKAFLVTLSGLK
jgi:hypothetical protein